MTVTGRGYEGSSKSPISYFRKHSAPKFLGLGPGKAARLVRATRPVHLVEEVQQERNVRPLLAFSHLGTSLPEYGPNPYHQHHRGKRACRARCRAAGSLAISAHNVAPNSS